MSPGLPQSVQARLVGHAKKLGVDPNLVLARYATERLLYRLSRSRHADRFVLKGAWGWKKAGDHYRLTHEKVHARNRLVSAGTPKAVIARRQDERRGFPWQDLPDPVKSRKFKA